MKMLAQHQRLIQVMDLFNSKYNCNVCRRKLRYKADKYIHSKLKHSGIDKDYSLVECPVCQRVFKTFYKLTQHLMTSHFNEKPYGCRICKQRFAAFINLKRHCYQNHFKKDFLELIEYENSQIEDNLNDFNRKSFTFMKKVKCNETTLISSSDSFNEDELSDVKEDTESISSHNDSIIMDMDNDNDSEKSNIYTLITQFNVHKCKMCSIVFRSSAEYLCHNWKKHMIATINIPAISQHPNNECWLCWSHSAKNESIFEDEVDLIQHLEEKHLNETYYKCSYCSNSYFSNLESAKAHFAETHGYNSSNKNMIIYACANCEQIFLNGAACLEHFIKNLKCNMNFKMNKNMNKYECIKCNIIFYNKNTFDVHLSQHSYLESVNNILFHESNALLNKQLVLIKKTPIFVKNNLKTSHHLNRSSCTTANPIRPQRDICMNKIDDIASRIISLKHQQERQYQQLQQIQQQQQFRLGHSLLDNNQMRNSLSLCNNAHLNIFYENLTKFTKNVFNDENICNQRKVLENTNINSNQSPRIIPNFNPNQHANNPILESGFLFPSTSGLCDFKLNRNFMSPIQPQQSLNHLLYKSGLLTANHGFKIQNNPTLVQTSSNRLIIKEETKHTPDLSELNDSAKHIQNKPSNSGKISNNEDLSSSCKCDLCGYGFKTDEELVEHKQKHWAHNPKRPFKCHLCQVTFAKTDQLMRHMIVHQASEMDSVCQICFSSFSRKQDLDRHMLFHFK